MWYNIKHSLPFLLVILLHMSLTVFSPFLSALEQNGPVYEITPFTL